MVLFQHDVLYKLFSSTLDYRYDKMLNKHNESIEWNRRTKLTTLSLECFIFNEIQFVACLLFYNVSKIGQKLMVTGAERALWASQCIGQQLEFVYCMPFLTGWCHLCSMLELCFVSFVNQNVANTKDFTRV